MKTYRRHGLALSAVLSTALLACAAQAESVDAALKAGADKLATAQASQQRIDQIADETYGILREFKTVNKQIEGLAIYNAQLERQIASQRQAAIDLKASIENATIMERQILPLASKMLDALEQFVTLDLPFKRAERLAAIAQVRSNFDSTRFSAAEKFRQVLELYDIESQYSRTIDQYQDMVAVSGEQRQVNILRFGRIALMYQTTDRAVTGVWNADTRAWEVHNDYRSAVAKGIRIAKKQAAVDIVTLPIPAPEKAQ
jgi:hypothetical protein